MMTKAEIEMLQHANQTQAQEIHRLKDELRAANLTAQKLHIERTIVQSKHSGLLKEFRAFKDLIRHLGSATTDIEWQDHESAQSS